MNETALSLLGIKNFIAVIVILTMQVKLCAISSVVGSRSVVLLTFLPLKKYLNVINVFYIRYINMNVFDILKFIIKFYCALFLFAFILMILVFLVLFLVNL